MPEYWYIDAEGHETIVAHPMLWEGEVICDYAGCGLPMWKRPSLVPVNWGGLRPSQGSPAPDVQELIDTAPERRDDFIAKHEQHERDTEHES